MSKKSALHELDVRRAQKLQAQHRQTWEDLENIYTSIVDGMITIGHRVNEAAIQLNQFKPSNLSEIAITVKGIERDLLLFTDDLVKIHKGHEGKKGVITDEDELALCFCIYNDYVELNERFRAIIFNPMLTITESLSETMTQSTPEEVNHDTQE